MVEFADEPSAMEEARLKAAQPSAGRIEGAEMGRAERDTLQAAQKIADNSNLAIDRIRDIGRDAKFELPDNCFRHSFISHRIAPTGNVAETALEAGNSPQIIFATTENSSPKKKAKRGLIYHPIKPASPGCLKHRPGRLKRLSN